MSAPLAGPVIDADQLRSARHTATTDPATTDPATTDPATTSTGGRTPLVVLDVRWHLGRPGAGLDDYDEGHVPGAVFVDLDSELAGTPGRAGRHPLPDPDALEETLRRAGVDDASTVVIYDGGDGLAATRAWWVLRWAGLAPERVAVLDGGFPAWVAAGGEVTTAGSGARPPGYVTVSGGAMPVLTADAAAELASPSGKGGSGRTSGHLLDARAPERYRGETEPMDPVAGHVPGARNLPASQMLDADGRWRSPEDLAAVFAAAGIGTADSGDGDTVGAYCGSGVSATMLVLGMERAGLRTPTDPAGLYIGSWSHWSGSKRPVETGPGPRRDARAGG